MLYTEGVKTDPVLLPSPTQLALWGESGQKKFRLKAVISIEGAGKAEVTLKSNSVALFTQTVWVTSETLQLDLGWFDLLDPEASIYMEAAGDVCCSFIVTPLTAEVGVQVA